jgi:PBP1b-binding outer membrane lipoprotein LpoB
MRQSFKVIATLALALFLTGCFGDTKADILKKAKGVDTTEQLEAALGKPDEVDKIGPLEQWTYEASDGKVVFAIVAGKVTLEATQDKAKN